MKLIDQNLVQHQAGLTATEPDRILGGMILDFVGIFERLEAALAFDSEDVSGVVEDIDLLRQLFERLIGEGKDQYLSIGAGLHADKYAEAILEHFRSSEQRETFYRFYREVEEVYEILSPDPFLRPHIDAFADLTAVYRLLRVSYEPHVDIDRSFLRKTADLVRQHTESGRIIDPDEIYKIDEGVLDLLADEDVPDTVKVFNLLKVLDQEVRKRASQAPYLRPIGERAEEIARLFHERQMDALVALDELLKLKGEAEAADEARQETNLTVDGFSVYWVLQHRMGVANPEQIANAADVFFTEHPHWKTVDSEERDVRTGLYKALLEAEVDNVVEVVGGLLTMLKAT